MTDTDVIVVGGGATGVGIVRDLAMRGLDVTLFERGGLGSGTTGRSHGLLHSGARYATADPEGAAHCIQENRILRDIGGAAIEETGGLFVQLDEDDPDHFEARIEACRELDIPATELSASEARDRVPELTVDLQRAFEVPDGAIYPSRLVAATAESARQHGATLRTNTPIEDIRIENGRVVGVEADGEFVAADHVVNAAGAWAGEIAAMAGLDIEMAPTKGVMVAVDRPTVTPVINRCRPPTDGDIAVPHEHGVILGTTSTPVDDSDAATEDDGDASSEAVAAMLEEGAAMLPAVAEADINRVYWGVRPLYGGADGHGRDASRGFQIFVGAEDGRPGMTTVTGGKLTTYRLMAEAVADTVCESLGIDEPCRTAEESLPAGDADTLDALVAEFCTNHPADEDVV
ncbi:FAD-dependent oxidoreductase [Natronomonas halophila]|uniref:FAD-dependent oxidoreductase n=1 Tax=Natronomonas halophila TaxID=2747817 RepID=UPI0015B4E188|nr:FAD-dependent oxidoreductase [Natronomonas halophila]QLD84466.1 FAD-dependent oxidoreductase [Natronomonas halophila]